jgi:hypothetical protein
MLTVENHRQLESLYEALALLIVELEILLAQLHLQLGQFGAVVVHVRALLIHLLLDRSASLARLAKHKSINEN